MPSTSVGKDESLGRICAFGARLPSFFMLNPPNGEQPVKFDIVKKPYAICCQPDYGSIFGAGTDLLIASNCIANTDSYSNLPHSYDGPSAAHLTLFGDYNFAISDYEVYTLATTHGHSHSQSPRVANNGQALGVPSMAKYDRC